MRHRVLFVMFTLGCCGCQLDGTPGPIRQTLDVIRYPNQTHCYARTAKSPLKEGDGKVGVLEGQTVPTPSGDLQ